ncbi:2-hydroxy-6-oxononadienedioate/2-hydroxy-6- oxononatrienedioate hydrolase [Senna tora]|uniref:2-hydroxy-6-oxononadienedioate/2-hydroxy-6-oxononatrienedioate hydrolase n=1 Tax=Senna tora TaxID=362788 RepID=A0A834TYF0_9FABA|nr:2-hydroxy-6-oxononadienedioate/2-hydroxy-6- oxononatrienedioate hydrolase [Senna tora]
MEKWQLVVVPSPGINHLPSTVEFAKLLINHDHRLTITVLIISEPSDTTVDSYINSLTSSPSFPKRLHLNLLPAHSSLPHFNHLTSYLEGIVEIYKPRVREVVSKLDSDADSPRIAGFIVDMFCTAMIDIAEEFGFPSLVFLTSNAAFLGAALHLHTLRERDHIDTTASEFKESGKELAVPSFANNVPVTVLPGIALGKEWKSFFLNYGRGFKRAKGIIVNTVEELESHAIHSLSKSDNTKVYPVGPILGHVVDSREKSEIIEWLDNQPPSSVIFLCFGSKGSFDADQAREIASALEKSGVRFLWSLRKPGPKGGSLQPSDYSDYTEVLPKEFLERTAGIGRVIGWAPQTQVLAHQAIGGFVSHCGWNSVLESVYFGVPIATWPIYAEQQINAFELVRELKMGVEISLDYNMMFEFGTKFVSAEKIEKGIRDVMKEDNEIRKKVKGMSEICRKALTEGGSSYFHMTKAGVFRAQWGFASPVRISRCGNRCKNLYISRIRKFPSALGDSDYPTPAFNFVASASSAPSVSGSGAEYSEQLVDVGTMKKRKGIAGVDQDELVDPKLLADPDSYFCEFKGVHIHHKIYDVESQTHSSFQNQTLSRRPHKTKRLGFPMILLHGFGASVFSWKQVMKPLAEVTDSKVLAFDRPAFGLTSRVNFSGHLSSRTDDTRPLNPYSMAFSVLATLYFMDLLNTEKVILVGHSAGSLVAVNTYFEAPERVAALILIAPAILAPLTAPKIVKGNQVREDNQIKEDNSSPIRSNPFLGLYKILSMITKYVSGAITWIMKGMIYMLSSLYKKFLSAILRSTLGIILVRMVIDKFGIAAVRNAWYDPKQVAEHVLHGYTKPLRTKDWDRALVEFTAAMLLDEESKTKPPSTQRLHEISCPVLIVTGDSDRLVPSWNAERLARVIPGSSLEVIKQCGHLPHEEKVEEFISAVEKFLQRLIGNPSEQYVQPAAI